MIDLHAHLLPGIDDGPADLEASVRLAEAAAASGVTVMAATPHLRPDHPRVRPAELASRVEELRAALTGVPLEIVAGAEVDLYRGLSASDEELRLASYGQRGTDLLVETPYGPLPPEFDDLLFRLRARGYRLLLAHPERSRDFQRAPKRLATLAREGTLLQITADSLLAGGRTGRFARSLVAEGVAHVIASDAHGSVRRAGLADGVAATARAAPRRAQWMVTDAPAAILAGQPLPPAPAQAGGGTSLLRRISQALRQHER